MHVSQKEEEEAEVTTEVQEMVEEVVPTKEQEVRGNLVVDGKVFSHENTVRTIST
jgi:hypothetical protein